MSSLMRIGPCEDLFDEDRTLRRSMDLPTKQQPTQDSRVKLEDPDVQVQVHTQGTGSSS